MISKNEILKLIREVKEEMNEAPTPAPAPAAAATPAAGAKPPAGTAAPAAAAPTPPPADVITVLQGVASYLTITKHPQLAAIKEWMNSVGVQVK